MKNVFCFVFIIGFGMGCFAQKQDTIYQIVDTPAENVEGMGAWFSLLGKVKWQYKEEDGCIPASIAVNFIVKKDGSISDITIRKSSRCPDFDTAFMEAVQLYVRMKPAIKNNEKVNSYFILPFSCIKWER